MSRRGKLNLALIVMLAPGFACAAFAPSPWGVIGAFWAYALGAGYAEVLKDIDKR